MTNIDTAIGSIATGLVGVPGTSIDTAIGNTVLAATVSGTSMTTSSISGWLSSLATVVGSISGSDTIYTATNTITVKKCNAAHNTVSNIYSVSPTSGIYTKDLMKSCSNVVKAAAGADLYISCTGLNAGCSAKLDAGTFLAYCLDCWDGQ